MKRFRDIFFLCLMAFFLQNILLLYADSYTPQVGNVLSAVPGDETITLSQYGAGYVWYADKTLGLYYSESWPLVAGLQPDETLITSPVLGNFDYDAALEIVYISERNNNYFLHIYNHAGQNSTINTFQLPEEPTSQVLISDLNNNGTNEIIIPTVNGNLLIYKAIIINGVDVQFQNYSLLDGHFNTGYSIFADIKDVNKDKYPDIILTVGDGKVISFFTKVSNNNLSYVRKDLDVIDGIACAPNIFIQTNPLCNKTLLSVGTVKGDIKVFDFKGSNWNSISLFSTNIGEYIETAPLFFDIDRDNNLELLAVAEDNLTKLLKLDKNGNLNSIQILNNEHSIIGMNGYNIRPNFKTPDIKEFFTAVSGTRIDSLYINQTGETIKVQDGVFHHEMQPNVIKVKSLDNIYSDIGNNTFSPNNDEDLNKITFTYDIITRQPINLKIIVYDSSLNPVSTLYDSAFVQTIPPADNYGQGEVAWDGKGSAEYNGNRNCIDGRYRVDFIANGFSGEITTNKIFVDIDSKPPAIVSSSVESINFITTTKTNVKIILNADDAKLPLKESDLRTTAYLNTIIYFKNLSTGDEVYILRHGYCGTNTFFWKGIDENNGNYPLSDGEYQVKLQIKDLMGNKTNVIVPGIIRIDRTPALVTAFSVSPSVFMNDSGNSLQLKYTLANKNAASLVLKIENIRGEKLFSRNFGTVPMGNYVFPETGKTWDEETGINNFWTQYPDGSYIFKIETLDNLMTDENGKEIGNRYVGMNVAIKNRIPAAISYPADENLNDDVYPEVSGIVNITGTALDPDIKDPSNFDYYRLFFAKGKITASTLSIGEVEDPYNYNGPDVSGLDWFPVSVPDFYQNRSLDISNSATSLKDRPYPYKYYSRRTVANGSLGYLDVSLFTATNYSLLLVTKDKDGNVGYDLRNITINTLSDQSKPNIQITEVFPDTVPIIIDAFTMKIEVKCNLTQALGKKANEIFEVFPLSEKDGVYEEGNVLYRTYLENQTKTNSSFFWNGKNINDKYIADGRYRFKVTAIDSDNRGVTFDSHDKEIQVIIGKNLVLEKYEINSSFPGPIYLPSTSMTFNYNISKNAYISAVLDINQNSIIDSGDLNIISNQFKTGFEGLNDTDYSFNFNVPEQDGIYNVLIKAVSATDPSDIKTAIVPIVVSGKGINTSSPASITNIHNGDILESVCNFDWYARATGTYDPLRKMDFTVEVDSPSLSDETGQLIPTFPWVDYKAKIYKRGTFTNQPGKWNYMEVPADYFNGMNDLDAMNNYISGHDTSDYYKVGYLSAPSFNVPAGKYVVADTWLDWSGGWFPKKEMWENEKKIAYGLELSGDATLYILQDKTVIWSGSLIGGKDSTLNFWWFYNTNPDWYMELSAQKYHLIIIGRNGNVSLTPTRVCYGAVLYIPPPIPSKTFNELVNAKIDSTSFFPFTFNYPPTWPLPWHYGSDGYWVWAQDPNLYVGEKLLGPWCSVNYYSGDHYSPSYLSNITSSIKMPAEVRNSYYPVWIDKAENSEGDTVYSYINYNPNEPYLIKGFDKYYDFYTYYNARPVAHDWGDIDPSFPEYFKTRTLTNTAQNIRPLYGRSQFGDHQIFYAEKTDYPFPDYRIPEKFYEQTPSSHALPGFNPKKQYIYENTVYLTNHNDVITHAFDSVTVTNEQGQKIVVIKTNLNYLQPNYVTRIFGASGRQRLPYNVKPEVYDGLYYTGGDVEHQIPLEKIWHRPWYKTYDLQTRSDIVDPQYFLITQTADRVMSKQNFKFYLDNSYCAMNKNVAKQTNREEAIFNLDWYKSKETGNGNIQTLSAAAFIGPDENPAEYYFKGIFPYRYYYSTEKRPNFQFYDKTGTNTEYLLQCHDVEYNNTKYIDQTHTPEFITKLDYYKNANEPVYNAYKLAGKMGKQPFNFYTGYEPLAEGKTSQTNQSLFLLHKQNDVPALYNGMPVYPTEESNDKVFDNYDVILGNAAKTNTGWEMALKYPDNTTNKSLFAEIIDSDLDENGKPVYEGRLLREGHEKADRFIVHLAPWQGANAVTPKVFVKLNGVVTAGSKYSQDFLLYYKQKNSISWVQVPEASVKFKKGSDSAWIAYLNVAGLTGEYEIKLIELKNGLKENIISVNLGKKVKENDLSEGNNIVSSPFNRAILGLNSDDENSINALDDGDPNTVISNYITILPINSADASLLDTSSDPFITVGPIFQIEPAGLKFWGNEAKLTVNFMHKELEGVDYANLTGYVVMTNGDLQELATHILSTNADSVQMFYFLGPAGERVSPGMMFMLTKLQKPVFENLFAKTSLQNFIVKGNAFAGSSVKLLVNESEEFEGFANENGKFAISVKLIEGRNSVKAKSIRVITTKKGSYFKETDFTDETNSMIVDLDTVCPVLDVWVTNDIISPNLDGIKDSTVVHFKASKGLESVQLQIADGDNIVRTIIKSSNQEGRIIFDGKDNTGIVLQTKRYTYKIFAQDFMDNYSKTNIGFILVDTNKPISLLKFVGGNCQYNSNCYYINKSTEIGFNVNDISGNKKTEYKIDTGIWGLYTELFNLALNPEYLISVRSLDKAGNLEDVKEYRVRSDNLKPDVEVRITQNGYQISNTIFIAKNSILSLSATDSISGIKNASYSFNNEMWQSISNNGAITRITNIDEGIYQLNVKAEDRVNNISDIKHNIVIIDLTPPIIDLVMASSYQDDNGMTYAKGNNNFRFSAFDPVSSGITSGIGRIEYKVDNSGWKVWNQNIDISIPAGEHVLYYRAYDKVNNVAYKSNRFMSDSNPPGITLLMDDPKYINYANRLFINENTRMHFETTDTNGSGIAKIEYRIEKWGLRSENNNWIENDNEFNVQNVDDGEYGIKYYCMDQVSNQSELKETSFYVDNTPPSSVFTPFSSSNVIGGLYINPVTGYGYAPANYKFKFVSADQTVNGIQSGLKEVRYSFKQGSEQVYDNSELVFDEGFCMLYYYALDNVGNSEVPKIFFFAVDGTPPDVKFCLNGRYYSQSNAAINENTQISFIANDGFVSGTNKLQAGGSGVKSVQYRIGENGIWKEYSKAFDFVEFPEGRVDLYYKTIDNVGNTSTPKKITLIIDRTAPEAIISIQANRYKGYNPVYVLTNSIITLTPKDNLSPINSVTYGWDGSYVTYNNEGISITFYTDFSSTETISYATNYYPIQSELNFTSNFLEQGRHSLTASVKDWAGLESQTVTNNFVITNTLPLDIVADIEPPQLDVYYKIFDKYEPIDLYSTNILNLGFDSKIKIAGKDKYSGISEIQYKINEDDWITYSEPFSLSSFNEGNYKIKYKVSDNAGNGSFFSNSFALDKIPPMTALITNGIVYNRAGTAYVLSGNTYKLQSKDNGSGIEKIYLRDKDSGYREYQTNETITLANKGDYQAIYYRAIDKAGNYEDEKECRVIIDAYSPYSSIQVLGTYFDYLNGSPVVINNAAEFEITSIDSGSGIKKIEYKIDDKQWREYIGAFNLSYLNDGSHAIYYRGIDGLYQTEDQKTKQVILDRGKPVLSDVSASPLTVYPNGVYDNKLNISFICSEDAFVTIRILNSDKQVVTNILDNKFQFQGINNLIWNCKISGTAVPDGLYSFLIESRDVIGNIGLPVTGQFAVSSDSNTIKIVNFSLDNQYFSPNNDGIKDSTTLSFNIAGMNSLANSHHLNVSVYSRYGQFVKTLADESISEDMSYSITWDGLNNQGNAMSSGEYLLYIKVNSQPVIQTVKVFVDTDNPEISKVVLDNNIITSYYQYSTNVEKNISAKIYTKDVSSPNLSEVRVEILNTNNGIEKNIIKQGKLNKGIIEFSFDGLNNAGYPLDEGYYRLKTEIIDLAGNISQPVYNRITIENTKPMIHTNSVAPCIFSPNYPFGDGRFDLAKISFTLSDNLATNLFVTLTILDENQTTARTLYDNSLIFNAHSSILVTNFIWDGRGNDGEQLSDGKYYYKITAKNSAGLEAVSQMGEMVIDTAPPSDFSNISIMPKIVAPEIANYAYINYNKDDPAYLTDKVYGQADNYTWEAIGKGEKYPIQNYYYKVDALGKKAIYPNQLFDYKVSITGKQTIKRLTIKSNGDSFSPSIGVDNSGKVHMFWNDGRNGLGEVFYKRSIDNGNTWGNDIRLITSSPNGNQNEMAYVENNGKIHVIWQVPLPNWTWELHYKRSDDGGVTWGNDKYLTTCPSWTFYPSISVGSDNKVHIVWYNDRNDGKHDLYYKRSVDGGVTWENDKCLTTSLRDIYVPSVAQGKNGIVHVVWQDNRDDIMNSELYYKRSTDGGVTWENDKRLTITPNSEAFPKVEVGNNGKVCIVCQYSGEIHYKSSTDGGVTWGNDNRLTSGNSSYPSISIGNDGKIYIVWVDNRDGNSEIYFKRSIDAGTTWDLDKRLTKTLFWSESPSIKVGNDGTIHIAWDDYIENRGYEIFYTKSIDNGITWLGETYTNSTIVKNQNIAYNTNYHVPVPAAILNDINTQNFNSYEIKINGKIQGKGITNAYLPGTSLPHPNVFVGVDLLDQTKVFAATVSNSQTVVPIVWSNISYTHYSNVSAKNFVYLSIPKEILRTNQFGELDQIDPSGNPATYKVQISEVSGKGYINGTIVKREDGKYWVKVQVTSNSETVQPWTTADDPGLASTDGKIIVENNEIVYNYDNIPVFKNVYRDGPYTLPSDEIVINQWNVQATRYKNGSVHNDIVITNIKPNGNFDATLKPNIEIRTIAETAWRTNKQYQYVWDGKNSSGLFVPDSVYQYKMFAADEVGNQKVRTENIEVDSTKPVVSFTLNKKADNQIEIFGNAYDKNLELYSMEYGFNISGAERHSLGTNNFQVKSNILALWDISNLTTDDYIVKLTARDIPGNISVFSNLIRITNNYISILSLNNKPIEYFSPLLNNTFKVSYNLSQNIASNRFSVYFTYPGAALYSTGITHDMSGTNKIFEWDGKSASILFSDNKYIYELATQAPSDKKYKYIVIDSSAPEIQINYPIDHQVVKGAISIKGTACDTNFKKYDLFYRQQNSTVKILLNSSSGHIMSSQLAFWNTSGMDDGKYFIILSAQDKAENQSETSNLIIIDTKAPVARINSIKNGDVITGVVQITGTASDENLKNYIISYKSMNDNTWTDIVTGTGNKVQEVLGTWDISALNGDYQLRLQVTDLINSVSSVIVNIRIDNTLPIALITSPLNNKYVRKDISIYGNIDDANLSAYSIACRNTLDNKNINIANVPVLMPISGGLLGVWNTEFVLDGNYELKLIVLDKANHSTSQSIYEIVDNTVPVVSILNLAPFTNVQGTADVHVLVQDQNLSEYKLEYGVGDNPIQWATLYSVQSLVGNAIDITISWDTTSLIDGTYTLRLTGIDKALNTNRTLSVVYVDNTKPDAVITAPSALSEIDHHVLAITGTARDDKFSDYSIYVGSGNNPNSWTEITNSYNPVNNNVLGSLNTESLWGMINLKLVVNDLSGNSTTNIVKVKKTPNILISEVKPADASGSWTELFSYEKSIDLQDFILTDFEGVYSRLAREAVTIRSNQYAVVHWNANGISENDVSGDMNNNGYIDLYLPDPQLNYTNGLLALTINDLTVDALVWSDYKNSFSQSDVINANNLVLQSQWQGCFALSIKTNAVKLYSTNNSIGRITLDDHNNKYDWHSQIPSPGKPNFIDTTPPVTVLSLIEPFYISYNTTTIFPSTKFILKAIDARSSGNNTNSGVDYTEYAVNASAYSIYQNQTNIGTLEGAYTVQYHSIDKTGNIEQLHSTNLKLVIDSTPPVSKIIASGTLYTNGSIIYTSINTHYSITASDNLFSVKEIMVNIDNKGYTKYTNVILFQTQGSHTIAYYAIDFAGNLEQEHIFALTIDATPPQISLIPSQPYYNNGTHNFASTNFEYILQSFDNESGVKLVEYSINNNNWQVYSSAIHFTNNGIKYIKYRTSDNLGNLLQNSEEIYVDNVAPVSSLFVSGSIGSYIKPDTSIQIISSDPYTSGVSSGIKRTEYRINQNAWTNYAGPFTFIGMPDGHYSVDFRGYDNAGNIEQVKTKEIFIDSTPPMLSHVINYPEPFIPFIGPLAIGLNVNEQSIINLNIYHFNSLLVTLITNSLFNPGSLSSSWSGFTNGQICPMGQYKHVIQAIDFAGNKTILTNSFTLLWDIQPPRTSLSAGNPQYNNGMLYVTSRTPFILSAIDDLVTSGDGIGLGVKETKYKTSNSGWLKYTNTFTIPSEGPKIIWFYSVDVLNNTEKTQQLQVIVDNTPPNIPKNFDAYQIQSNVILYWQAVTNTDLAGYNVYRNSVKINSTLLTGIVWTDISPVSDVYTYAATSVDKLGNESGLSMPVQIKVCTNISIISPVSGKYYRDKIRIKTVITAPDTRGIWIDAGYGQYPTQWKIIYADPHRRFNKHDKIVRTIWDTDRTNGTFVIRIRTTQNGKRLENSSIIYVDNTDPETVLLLNGSVISNGSHHCGHSRIPVIQADIGGILSFEASDPIVNGVSAGIKLTKYYLYHDYCWNDHDWDCHLKYDDHHRSFYDWEPCEDEYWNFHDRDWEGYGRPGSFRNWDGNPIVLQQAGNYKLIYFSEDNAIGMQGHEGHGDWEEQHWNGNMEEPHYAVIRVKRNSPPPPTDITKPVIKISGVASGVYYNTGVSPQITVTDEHLESVDIRLNGSPYTSGTLIAADGDYNINVSAKDTAGNKASTNISFSIDTTLPAIIITGIQNNAYYNKNVKANVSVSDKNLTGSSVSLDGNPYTSGTWISVEANHNLTAKAKDKAENIALKSVDFTIDKRPPQINVAGVEEGKIYAEATPVVTVIDPNLDISKTEIVLNGKKYISGTPITSNAAYLLSAHAEDLAGNSADKNVHFTIHKVNLTNTLLFSASFDNNANAQVASGNNHCIEGGEITIGDKGRLPGEALSESGRGAKYSAASNINATNGTMMLWVKPNWTSAGEQGRYLFSLNEPNQGNHNGFNINCVNDPPANLKEYMNLVVFGSKGTVLQIKDKNGIPSEYVIDKGVEISRWYADKSWTHLAWSWNAKTGVVRLWINGNSAGSFTNQSWTPNGKSDLWIGNRHDDESRKSECRIDDVKIFSRELTAEEIKQQSGVIKIGAVFTANPKVELAYIEKTEEYYCDRTYIITNMDSAFRGSLFIKTANDDKQFSANRKYLSFKTEEDLKVVIGFDSRVAVPSWLSSNFTPWLENGRQKTIGTTDVGNQKALLFKKQVAKGAFVELNGNGANNDNTYNYFMIIVK